MYVITGGGSGIGRALAHTLADQGQSVVIIGRRQQVLEEAAQYSPLITFCSADVSTQQGRQDILDYLSTVPKLQGLVHNAGVIEPIEAIEKLSLQQWQHVFDTNLNAPLFLTQLLLDKLANGRVLNIGSGVAYFPVKGWAAYCVSKAALSMLTRCWQLECQSPAFASVMPGIIDTNMQAVIRQEAQAMEPEKHDFFVDLKQENRLLKPETVSLFLAYLLLKVPQAEYSAQEWDIYDTTHHREWLIPPHVVPQWE